MTRISRTAAIALICAMAVPGAGIAQRIDITDLELQEPTRLGEPLYLRLPGVTTCLAAPLDELSVKVAESSNEMVQQFEVTIHNPNPMNTIQCDAFFSASLTVQLGDLAAAQVDVSLVLTGVRATEDDLEALEPEEVASTSFAVDPLPGIAQPGNALEPIRLAIHGCPPQADIDGSRIHLDPGCSEEMQPEIVDVELLSGLYGPHSLSVRLPDGSIDYQVTQIARVTPPSITGAWFDAENPGHGFTLQLLSPQELLAYWYVYDDAGNQIWLYGVLRSGGPSKITPEPPPTSFGGAIYITSGGGFPPAFDPDAVEVTQIGSVGIGFTSCSTADVSWHFNDETALPDGSISIEQLSRTDGAECRDR